MQNFQNRRLSQSNTMNNNIINQYQTIYTDYAKLLETILITQNNIRRNFLNCSTLDEFNYYSLMYSNNQSIIERLVNSIDELTNIPATTHANSQPIQQPRQQQQRRNALNNNNLLSSFLDDIRVSLISDNMFRNRNNVYNNGVYNENLANEQPTREQIVNATRNISFNDLINPNTAICPISLEHFNNNSQITEIINCGHIFNTSCLDRWFLTHHTCPVCRYDIREQPITEPTFTEEVEINSVQQQQSSQRVSNNQREAIPLTNDYAPLLGDMTERLLQNLFNQSNLDYTTTIDPSYNYITFTSTSTTTL